MKKAKSRKSSGKNVTDALIKMMSVSSPSELLQNTINQVNKTKGDISSKVAGEMIALVRKIDFVKEFSKFAEDHKFKITMDVEISKKDKSK